MPTEIKLGQYWNFNADYFYEVIEITGETIVLQYLDPEDPFQLVQTRSELLDGRAWLVCDKEERGD